jgi:hypothetical protein
MAVTLAWNLVQYGKEVPCILTLDTSIENAHRIIITDALRGTGTWAPGKATLIVVSSS